MQGPDDVLVGPPDMSQSEVGRPATCEPISETNTTMVEFPCFPSGCGSRWVVDGATLYGDRMQKFLSCSPSPVGRCASLYGV